MLECPFESGRLNQCMKRESSPQGRERKDPPGLLAILRSMEVPPEILQETLGKEIQERLTALRPALMVWELTEEHTAFFLHHREDLTRILAFVLGGGEPEEIERGLSPEMQWYLRELRQDLRNIIDSGATRIGMGSHFAIENRPSAFPPIRPHDWNPQTVAFVEQLRPKLATMIKARHIDHWLQTPQERLGRLSPIQMIEFGCGERVRALIEEMSREG